MCYFSQLGQSLSEGVLMSTALEYNIHFTKYLTDALKCMVSTIY